MAISKSKHRSVPNTPDLPTPMAAVSPAVWNIMSTEKRKGYAHNRRARLRLRLVDWMMAANKEGAGFSTNEISILAALTAHCADDHGAFPGLETLGAMVGMSRKTVQGPLDSLVARGLVNREKRGRGYLYVVPYLVAGMVGVSVNEDASVPNLHMSSNDYKGVAEGVVAGEGCVPNLHMMAKEGGDSCSLSVPNLHTSGETAFEGEAVSGENVPKTDANLGCVPNLHTNLYSPLNPNTHTYLPEGRLEGLVNKGLQEEVSAPAENLAAEQGAGQGREAAGKGGCDLEAQISRLGRLAQAAACGPRFWTLVKALAAVRGAVEARGLLAVMSVVEGLQAKSLKAFEIKDMLDSAVVPGEAPVVAPVAAVAPLGEGATEGEKKGRDVLSEIKARVGAGKFSKWFTKVSVVVTDKQVKLYCGQGYIRDWIAGDLANSVAAAVHAVGLGGHEVQYLTGSGKGVSPTVAPEPAPVVEVRVAEAIEAAAIAADENTEQVKIRVAQCGRLTDLSEDEILWDEALSSINDAPIVVKALKLIKRVGKTIVFQASSFEQQLAVEYGHSDAIANAWASAHGERPCVLVLPPGVDGDHSSPPRPAVGESPKARKPVNHRSTEPNPTRNRKHAHQLASKMESV